MKNKLVSAVIVSWNRKEELKKCIDSILNQDYKPIEIIVVDNGSNDGTLELLSKYKSKIRLIKNVKNLGACKTRNMGIANAGGEFILFVDSDAELYEKNMVSKMMKWMNKDNMIGGIGAVVLSNIKKNEFFTSATYLRWDGFLDKRKSLFKVDEPRYDIDYVSSCVSMFRKKALLDVGGFDEHYFYGPEDVDIGIRIKKNGWKIMIDPNIKAFHYGSDKGRKKINRFYPSLIHKKSYLVIKNYSLIGVMKYILFSYGLLFREFFNVIVKTLTLLLIPYMVYKKNHNHIKKFINRKTRLLK